MDAIHIRNLAACDTDPICQRIHLRMHGEFAPQCIFHDIMERMHPQKAATIHEMFDRAKTRFLFEEPFLLPGGSKDRRNDAVPS